MNRRQKKKVGKLQSQSTLYGIIVGSTIEAARKAPLIGESLNDVFARAKKVFMHGGHGGSGGRRLAYNYYKSTRQNQFRAHVLKWAQ